jgi:hypothetical protein
MRFTYFILLKAEMAFVLGFIRFMSYCLPSTYFIYSIDSVPHLRYGTSLDSVFFRGGDRKKSGCIEIYW